MSYAGRRQWFRGLGFRLNAWYVLVFALVFGAAALGVRHSARRAIDRAQLLYVKTEIAFHRSRLENSGLQGFQQFVAARREQTSTRWLVRVSDADGHTLLFDAPRADLEFASQDLKPRPGAHTIFARGKHEREREPWRVLSTQVVGSLWLQVGIEDRTRQAQLAAVERSFWLLLALGLTLGALGGIAVTRRALRPLRDLAQTSRRVVEAGDLTARVPVRDSADELDELSRLFNRVLDRNQRLVEGMRQALDNVAHDLRTPLSSLRSSAELALQHEDDPALLRDALADCVEDSERVLRMLHTLMDISEAETGVMHLELAPVEVSALLRELFELYQHVAEESGVRLQLHVTQPLYVQGDRQRLTRAVANLVDNAIKYNSSGGEVSLEASATEAEVRVVVSDTGSGIEAVHLDKIWQRLYRADQSRSRRGLGLGLSFVRAIVEAHGGRASVQSTPGQGSRFELVLPRGRAPQAAADGGGA